VRAAGDVLPVAAEEQAEPVRFAAPFGLPSLHHLSEFVRGGVESSDEAVESSAPERPDQSRDGLVSLQNYTSKAPKTD
jgi:hypothetical protein